MSIPVRARFSMTQDQFNKFCNDCEHRQKSGKHSDFLCMKHDFANKKYDPDQTIVFNMFPHFILNTKFVVPKECYIVWQKTSHLNHMIRGEFNGPFYMIKYSKFHEQEIFKDLPQTYHKKGFNERFVIPTECPYLLEHAVK